MKKLKTTPKPETDQDQKGRRDFLTKAILGTGALAVTPLSSTSAKEESPGAYSDADTDQASACTPIKPGDLKDNWRNPTEYDATNPLNPPLCLNAQYHSHPNVVLGVSPSEVDTTFELFSYNGDIPGPTIRCKGDTTVHVQLTNTLSGNDYAWAAKVNKARYVDTNCYVPDDVPDWAIGDRRVYGPHQQHTTNLHTHGLHITPDNHEDTGEHSDNVLLRIIPLEDYCHRYPKPYRDKRYDNICDEIEENTGKLNPNIKLPQTLMDNEVVYTAKYKFALGQKGGIHYPGTFWYHPHPHGATYDQVAGGMAGFFIVEGDIDDYYKKTILNTKSDKTNAGLKERLIMVQRVIGPAVGEAEAVKPKGNEQKVQNNIVNGYQTGQAIFSMAPGTIERWRVLNGSVDGQGYFDFIAVDKAAFDQDLTSPCITLEIDGQQKSVENVIWKYNLVQAQKDSNGNYVRDKKGNLVLLANLNDVCGEMDYSALELTMGRCNAAVATPGRRTKCVSPDTNYSSSQGYKLYYKALDQLKALLTKHSTVGKGENTSYKKNQAKLYNTAFDGINLVGEDNKYYIRQISSLSMAPANRADYLFQAPATEGVYTVWGLWTYDATDRPSFPTNPFLIVATVGVSGKPVTNNNIVKNGLLQLDFQGLTVPKVLTAVSVDETFDASKNAYRKRHVIYGGWGDASMPLINNLGPTEKWNTMTIDGKKYGVDNPMGHGYPPAENQMKLGTTEEWTLDNFSMSIYVVTDPDGKNAKPVYAKNYPKDGSWNPNGTYKLNPDDKNAKSVIISKAADHPFHIHQNPFWVTSIKDAEGNELLPEGKARWQDVVRIPRNGGRVVFLSRFWDYYGKFVNHCHLLQHEDWGMMQVVSVNIKEPTMHGPEFKSKNFAYPCLSTFDMFDWNYNEKYLNPEPPKPGEGGEESENCPNPLDPAIQNGVWNTNNKSLETIVVGNAPSKTDKPKVC